MINIVLFEPEIAGNTANIVRSCNLTKSTLHLIRPFGFILDEKHMGRGGLDYWDDAKIIIHDSFEDFMESIEEGSSVFLSTTHTNNFYTDVEYKDGDYILFGSESKGVYDYIHESLDDHAIKIPIREDSDRSLNLANSVNIVLYEAMRQLNFKGMR